MSLSCVAVISRMGGSGPETISEKWFDQKTEPSRYGKVRQRFLCQNEPKLPLTLNQLQRHLHRFNPK